MKTLILVLLFSSVCFAQSDIKKELLSLVNKVDSALVQKEDSLQSVLELNDMHRLNLFTKWRVMLYKNFVSSVGVPKMHVYIDMHGWIPIKDVPKEWLYDQDTVKLKNVMYHTLWRGDDWSVFPPPPEVND
jgi:hypothetical protein